MHLIFRYVRPYLKRMSLGLLIKFLGTIMDLFLPAILAHIIDEIVPLKDLSLVIRWGVVMLICSFLAILGNVIANRMAAWVARETTRRLRHDLFRKISYLSNRQIDGFTVPSLISRMFSFSEVIPISVITNSSLSLGASQNAKYAPFTMQAHL